MISVIIPCHPPHVQYLKSRSINTILKGTLLPDEIIVALSETSKEEGNKLEKELSNNFSFPIKVYTTTKKGYAGQNRNRGAQKAKHEILVFFDSDDLCHPQKLEITNYVFDTYNIKMFLHHYAKNGTYSDFQWVDIKNIPFLLSEKIFYFTFGDTPKRENATWIFTDRMTQKEWVYVGQPTHGHCAVHRDVFHKVKYPSVSYGEDTTFCLDVLWEFKSVVYADINLISHIKYRG